jgi:hypothetical protein
MNNKKNLLPKEKESEFNLYLGICEYNERYFCESDYQETIFSKYNEYINFYNSKGEPLINIIVNSYLKHFYNSNHLHLFIDWIISKKKINVNAQDQDGNTPLHLIAMNKFCKNYKNKYQIIRELENNLKKIKKADITIKNNNNLTPYDIEKNIVFNIIENKRRLKSKFDYTDSNEIQEKFNQAKTTNDLDQIIKDYYIMIKTNDSIVLATTKMCLDGQNSVPKKIKKKIIQHAIDNPYDFFDYEYLSSY